MPDFVTHETLPLATSPRIHALIEALSRHEPDALAAFWAAAERDGTPLVEPADSAPDACIVTFLWRTAAPLQQVLLIVDTLTDLYRRSDMTPCFMQHIEGTDVWHISYQLKADLRATYHFHPVGMGRPPLTAGAKSRDEWLAVLADTHHDPFNAKTFPSRRGRGVLSVLELPDAPAHRWWQPRPDTPQSRVIEQRISSDILKNERRVWVYQPAQPPADGTAYPLLVLLDGQVWIELAGIQTTLDNLIAAGEIPPMMALAIDSLDSDTRGEELTCNPAFVQFMTDELFSWARAHHPVTSDPTQTIISGQSYGGLASAYAVFHAPEHFGNALSQSGSFWWKEDDESSDDNEWLTRQLAVTPRQAGRFYVTVGWQEWMLLAPNRHLRDVLMAKGYPLIYEEYNGGHDYICWRGGIADGLIALTRSWREPAPAVQTVIRSVTITPRSTTPPQKPKFPAPEIAESPRITALKAALLENGEAAAHDFWAQAAAEGTPLIEPLADDPTHAIVTFLWRGGDENLRQVVVLANKFTDASVFDASVMERLPDSDVWYRSYRVRSDWCASYALAPVTATESPAPGGHAARLAARAQAVGSPVQRDTLKSWWSAVENALPDPLNQTPFNGRSLVALPDAPAQSWVEPRPDVPTGTLTEHTLTSEILGNQRRVWVYTPAGYTSDAQPHDVMVLLDGQAWVNEHPIMPTLDNLIAHGKIPPMVVIMPEALGFETRVREMAAHLPFVSFVTDELLTWAAEHWRISDAPERTIIAGLSLGGLTAALTGLLAAHRIGNVLSQSGSFWWANGSPFDADSEWLTQQYATLPARPLRFYIEVGLQEWVLLGPTRHLRNVLQAKGYDVTYSEFNGGHDVACFRGSIADGLMALTRG